jgi:hypothetical protein
MNIHRIWRINSDLVESNKDCELESIADIDHCLNWNGVMDLLNDSEDCWAVDNKCDHEHNNYIEDLEYPEQHVVSAAPKMAGLVLQTRMSKRQAGKVLVTVSAVGTHRNKRGQKK